MQHSLRFVITHSTQVTLWPVTRSMCSRVCGPIANICDTHCDSTFKFKEFFSQITFKEFYFRILVCILHVCLLHNHYILLSYPTYVFYTVLVHGLVQRLISSMSKLCSVAYSLIKQTWYGANSLHTLNLKINLINLRTSIWLVGTCHSRSL